MVCGRWWHGKKPPPARLIELLSGSSYEGFYYSVDCALDFVWFKKHNFNLPCFVWYMVCFLRNKEANVSLKLKAFCICLFYYISCYCIFVQVVDFCCGANDFSCLMKNRLDEMGKKRCTYRNFDITRPKVHFLLWS